MRKWRVMAMFLDALLNILADEMLEFVEKGPREWQAHLEAANDGTTNRRSLYDKVIDHASVSQLLQLKGFTLISSAGLCEDSAWG